MALTVQFQRQFQAFKLSETKFRIVKFFIHCQRTRFRNWIRWSVPILVLWGGETPTELDMTDRTILNHSAAASTTLSSENRNRCSLYNTVLISHNQTKEQVHKLNNSQHNIPSAEPGNKCDVLFYFPHLWCTLSPPHTLWCNNSSNFRHGGWIINVGVNIFHNSIITKVAQL